MAKAQAGIKITLQTKTFNFLVTNYNNANPAAAKYKNHWGVNNYGGLFMDYFPTQDGSLEHDRRVQHRRLQQLHGEQPDIAVGVRQGRERCDEGGRLLLQGPAGPVLPRPGLHGGGELEEGRLDLDERLDRHDPAAVLPAVLVREEVAAGDE